MPDVLHANITDALGIHEPKGISTATANEVYVSNGSGSGTWSPLYDIFTVYVDDISIPGTPFLPLPYAGRVVLIHSAISAAITTADEVITFSNAAGASMGTITITHAGSAGGDIDTLAPTTNNTFTAGTALRISIAGNSNTKVSALFSIVVERT